MPTDERLIDLLERWKESEAQGQAVDPAELCADCPELRPELERLHRVEGGMVQWLHSLDGSPNPTSREAETLPGIGSPVIPGYLVGTLLASGGMGEVYRARDTELDREVALKVIRPEKLSADLSARFRTEAKAVAALDHPHIVQIYEVGEYTTVEGAAAPYLAMEYVPGGTLEDRVRVPPTPAEAARIVQLLARAMAHAHARGVVHRDLKPANVLVAPPADEPSLNAGIGRPKVTDFGLARQERTGTKLTQEGTVMGTPTYMAPEQADGLEVGAPADVYALGVILYRLLSGKLPFESPSLSDLLYQIAHVPPPPLEDVPADLGRICASCLEKDPKRRPTAADLATRLEAWHMQGTTLTDPAVGKRPRPPGKKRSLSLQWTLLGCAGTLTLSFGLLLSIVMWSGQEQKHKGGPPDKGKSGDPPDLLRVKSFRLECFRVEDDKAHTLGTVSGKLGEKPLFTLPFATRVFVHAEFTQPAYAFLIAFNADGKAQLLWPINADKRPDRTIAPPKVDALKYPDRLGPTGQPVAFTLNDEPGGGLQAFALVLSSKPLPSFDEWQKGRDLSAWKRVEGVTGPFVADAGGVYPVLPGKGLVRGTEEELGKGPDLRPLVATLRTGVEWVEVLTIPVEAKP